MNAMRKPSSLHSLRRQLALGGFLSLCLAGAVSAQVGSSTFAARPALAGMPASGTANNIGGPSDEAGEPDHSSLAQDHASVWWKWRASNNGMVTLTLSGAGLKPVIAVYTGSDLSFLKHARVRSATSPTVGIPATVSFVAAAGTEYQIAADTDDGKGNLALSLTQTANAPAVAGVTGHNYFLYRPVLTGIQAKGEVCNLYYDEVEGTQEPDHSSLAQNHASAWWSWTAPYNGMVTMTVTGKLARPIVSVYTGTDLSMLKHSRVRSNTSPTVGIPATVAFLATAGTTYQIAADTYNGVANLTLDLTQTARNPDMAGIPGHNYFLYRPVLSGANARGVVCNLYYDEVEASREPDHSPLAQNHASAWWTWTAAHNGTVTLSVTGYLARPVVAVYDGVALSQLKSVAQHTSAAPGVPAVVSFSAVAGTAYQIAVDTYGGVANLDVNLQAAAAPASRLACSTSALTQTLRRGQQGAAQTFDVWNAGSGTLSYSISDTLPNVTVTPSSGTSTGERDRIAVNYATSGLAVGSYTGNITVSAAGVAGAPHTIAVSFRIMEAADGQPDFDADGRADLGVYHAVTGNWYMRESHAGQILSGGPVPFGAEGIPLPGDYDGDGLADFARYSPSLQSWAILQSGNDVAFGVVLGAAGAVPAPADYDGDGILDPAIFEPAAGRWRIRQSATGVERTVLFGFAGAVPVAGDYDGDGKADVAVYDSATARWNIQQTANGQQRNEAMGYAGVLPVPGDYDGDGRLDLAVYAAADLRWHIRQSSNGQTVQIDGWGHPQAYPVQADYTGDGKTDVALYVPATGKWYIRSSQDGTLVGGGNSAREGIAWGHPAVTPASLRYQILRAVGLVP